MNENENANVVLTVIDCDTYFELRDASGVVVASYSIDNPDVFDAIRAIVWTHA